MNATEWLKRDHELILEALDLLETLIARAAAGSPIPAEKARDLLDFFRTFADDYHHLKEETSLFPALESAGLAAPVSVMLSEHDEGRDLLHLLEKSIGGLSLPTPRMDPAGSLAERYINLLREHIHKENDVLFRLAERILMPSEDEDISAAFESLEAGRAGGRAFPIYQKRIADLKAWAGRAGGQ